MVCLGFEHGTAGWQEQTNPMSYGCPHSPPKGTTRFDSDLYLHDHFSTFLLSNYLPESCSESSLNSSSEKRLSSIVA